MVRAAGIDSGTRSVDIFAFDEERGVILDEAIPRDVVTENPKVVIDRLKAAEKEFGKFDAVVVSSGYGIPLKRVQEASDAEIALATFVSESDVKRRHRILGLRRLMTLFRESDFNAYFTPGVIQLPTVPERRKLNRIDMGTSDKLYSVALAVKDQAERLGRRFDETSFILVEVGFAYTSAIAVSNGKVVDAMAGTSGFPSYLGSGFIDGELAYAIANCCEFSKTLLFSGGAADFAGIDPFQTPIESFVRSGEGYELMIESIVKDVASLLPSLLPEEVVLSGRFSRIPEFFEDAKAAIEEFFSKLGCSVKVLRLRCSAKVAKEAAEGAAVIANGLAGGRYAELVDCLEIRKSRGSIFDHVRIPAGDFKVFERLILS
ncbi:MAG: DUF1464 family protein [Archaeoglobaceae archaeon]